MDTKLPQVTKSPTDEKVPVNGAAQFISKYENAKWAEWHFVSPDGSKDLDYKQAQNEFNKMVIDGGYTKDLTLKNIPDTFNGWKVYCKFSNDSGSVNTEMATVTVSGVAEANLPKVTKSPTGETVKPGGAADFVARYENAIWAEWHFADPAGTRDLTYVDAQNEFPDLVIKGGDQSILKLANIPAELNGWKVYCAFKNNAGTVTTDAAVITVQGQDTAAQIAQREPYTGRWAEEISGRCQITFSYAGEGSVRADIVWSSSASERSCWRITASAWKDMMVYDDGYFWIETWSDDNTHTESDQKSGLSGTFFMEDGKLHWKDDLEEEVVLVPA